MDINDIALDMDYDPAKRHLTLRQAIGLLLSKASKHTKDSIFIPVLSFEDSLRRFTSGNASISEVRDRAELLVESADDIMGLIASILKRRDADIMGCDGNAIVLMQENGYKPAAYQLSETIIRWRYNEATDDELMNMAQMFATYARAALHNVSLFESTVGGNFRVRRTHSNQAASVVYDNALFESVSTGSIAIRPAVLGVPSTPSRRGNDNRKRRWYLRYVIDRQ